MKGKENIQANQDAHKHTQIHTRSFTSALFARPSEVALLPRDDALALTRT